MNKKIVVVTNNSEWVELFSSLLSSSPGVSVEQLEPNDRAFNAFQARVKRLKDASVQSVYYLVDGGIKTYLGKISDQAEYTVGEIVKWHSHHESWRAKEHVVVLANPENEGAQTNTITKWELERVSFDALPTYLNQFKEQANDAKLNKNQKCDQDCSMDQEKSAIAKAPKESGKAGVTDQGLENRPHVAPERPRSVVKVPVRLKGVVLALGRELLRHARKRPELVPGLVRMLDCIRDKLIEMCPELTSDRPLASATKRSQRGIGKSISGQEGDEQAQAIHRSQAKILAEFGPRGKETQSSRQALHVMLTHFKQFAEANPEQAGAAARQCQEIVDRHQPLETQRVLGEESIDERRIHGVAEAQKITGLSRARVQQLPSDEGIGEFIAGRWLFSKSELLDYMKRRRPRGRPQKS